MEIFPVSTLSFNELLNGYQLEANGLAMIAESENFTDILDRFGKHEEFQVDKHQPASKTISKIVRSTGIIDTSAKSSVLRDIFYTAHLAACCELFNGNNIPAPHLNRSNISTWISKILGPYKDADDIHIEKISSKLHSMDAVRTIHILRYMGLFNRSSASIHQLSLGAGPATKDIRSIHLTPTASLQSAGHIIGQGQNNIHLSMNVRENKPADIIITDNDPQRKEQYQLLNESPTYNLLALNQDTNETLENLPGIMRQHKLPPRNLVVALRIDHRMIPDAQKFLKLITKSIDSTADIIVTMGSGFNIDDFTGRTRALMELFMSLKGLGLTPILIKLHGSGNLDQQRNTPSFGLSNITTYEILYCKLKKKKLLKIL